MPNNLVSQVEILTRLITLVNDAYPGSSYAGPTNQAYYGSQVGARFALGDDDKTIANNSTTLSGGLFQYVQLYASMTATPKVGLIAFWKTDTSYIATFDEPTGVSDMAGILVSATSIGNYGIIQIDGKVRVQFRATITKATPAATGDLVLAAAAGAGADVATADILADATSLTSTQARHILGITITSPTGGAASFVRLGAAIGQRMNF
jgi:hypothetical protein